jgi:hypothetical protein
MAATTIKLAIIIIILATFGVSSISNAQAAASDSDQVNIETFEARNATNSDALSLFALDDKSLQNLYVDNDDIDKLWSVWRVLFLPAYTRVLAVQGDELYLLTYNPLAEVGTISKWKRTDNGLRYQNFSVVTAEYLRGERISGEPHGPSWLNRFQDEHVIDLLSSSTQTVSDAFSRLSSPKAVEAALKDLVRPRAISRSSGKPMMTDRDVALLRVAGMAATLSKGLSEPESKTEITQAVECLDGLNNELCRSIPPPSNPSKPRKRKTAQPTSPPSVKDSAGPWIAEDFLRTGNTDIIFVGSAKVPGIIDVVSVSNHQITSVTKINFDEKLDQFVLKDMTGKF